MPPVVAEIILSDGSTLRCQRKIIRTVINSFAIRLL
uniref:Uncharacterized protein n=1 Tax=Setaria italica TaxID=4555 RepID=K4A3P8_SETIT